MNANAFRKLQQLAEQCSAKLKDKSNQSHTIWRGDMWAIIGACHDIEKARANKKSEVQK